MAGLMLVGAAACGADGPDGPGTATVAPDSVAPALGLVADRDAAVAAAVDVRADGCGPRVGFGTGSVVDDGVVVTAAHVVAGATAVEVIAVDGARSPADVVLFDPDLDLAVLRTEIAVGVPLAPRVAEASTGEEGVVVLPRESGGRVMVEIADVRVVRPANIRTTDIYLDRSVERAGFEVEGSIDPGDSGAMVVLPGGGAGVVWARSNRSERRAWAIDLPVAVVDGDVASLSDPVGVGPCIR